MIYIPELNENFVCYSFLDSETIRAYKTTNLNENNEIVDIYVNSHYLTNSNNVVLLEQPNCISNEKLTHDWKERNDLSDIIVISFFGALFFFGIPLLLIKKLFKRSVL